MSTLCPPPPLSLTLTTEEHGKRPRQSFLYPPRSRSLLVARESELKSKERKGSGEEGGRTWRKWSDEDLQRRTGMKRRLYEPTP